MGENGSLTDRLRSLTQGDRGAADRVLMEIMPDLRRIASRILRRERPGNSLRTMDLVHECWVRHLRKGKWEIENRLHFFLMVGRAMRQVLVDEARRNAALKRSARETLPLEEAALLPGNSRENSLRAQQMLEINILLDKLEPNDPDAVRMVEAHLLGCTIAEIAAETGLTEKQVRVRHQRGIDWLRKRLASKAAPADSGILGF